MTTQPPIKTLFANDIHRRIEEVIKVDQTQDEIRAHYTSIFEAYRETPNKPHEGIAIWVSGSYASGPRPP